jgi:uncharacterized protein
LAEKDKHGHTGTKITLSPDNIDYIFNGITNLINLDFSEIQINCCFEDVWDSNSAKKLLDELIRIADWIKDNNLYDKIYFALLDPEKYVPVDKDNLD